MAVTHVLEFVARKGVKITTKQRIKHFATSTRVRETTLVILYESKNNGTDERHRLSGWKWKKNRWLLGVNTKKERIICPYEWETFVINFENNNNYHFCARTFEKVSAEWGIKFFFNIFKLTHWVSLTRNGLHLLVISRSRAHIYSYVSCVRTYVDHVLGRGDKTLYYVFDNNFENYHKVPG